jgi:hypothetical protein
MTTPHQRSRLTGARGWCPAPAGPLEETKNPAVDFIIGPVVDQSKGETAGNALAFEEATCRATVDWPHSGKAFRDAWLCEEVVDDEKWKNHQKNNTRDSNVVPHRSTNLARRCLTSQSGRNAVLSSLYGRSCRYMPAKTQSAVLSLGAGHRGPSIDRLGSRDYWRRFCDRCWSARIHTFGTFVC